MVWEGEARGFRPFREKNQKGFKKEAIRYPPLCSLAASECPLLRLDFAFFCISNEEARLGLPNLSDWAEKLPLLSMNLLIWSSEKSVCTITAKLSTQLLFSWQFVPLYNLTIYWQDAICFFWYWIFSEDEVVHDGPFFRMPAPTFTCACAMGNEGELRQQKYANSVWTTSYLLLGENSGCRKNPPTTVLLCPPRRQ